jgi:hypothetical protein
MLLIAISAGVISGIVVAAFFFALDRNIAAAAATNGVWNAPQVKTPVLKRLENAARPLSAPARAGCRRASPAQSSGRPATSPRLPGGSVPAGCTSPLQTGRRLLLPINFPTVIRAPVTGVVAAVVGYFLRCCGSIKGSRGAATDPEVFGGATDLLTLVVESGMSLDEGLLSITGDSTMRSAMRSARCCERSPGPSDGRAREHGRHVRGGRSSSSSVDRAVGPDGRADRAITQVQATEMRRRQRRTAQGAPRRRRRGWCFHGRLHLSVLWIVLLGPSSRSWAQSGRP